MWYHLCFPGDDAIGRSLFYIDPFDQAAGSLNLPLSYPELAPPAPVDSPVEPNEPFYFALEPEEGADPKTSSPRGPYEQWLNSFDDNIKKVDPMFSPQTIELRNHNGSYNSDDSIDSDTEFSFIEDKGKKIPAKAKKKAPSFSVKFRTSETDGAPQATVKANDVIGDMPPISEMAFADILSNFKGFDPEDSAADGGGKEPSVDETGFVMIGKTSSGYEEPIPPASKIVTVPYAKVDRNKTSRGNGALKESATAVVEVDVTVPVTAADKQTNYALEPSEDAVAKYKSEPLPELPPKTLYEKSKEWENDAEKYENLKSIIQDETGTDRNDEDPSGEGEQFIVDSRHQDSEGGAVPSREVIYDNVDDEVVDNPKEKAKELEVVDPKSEVS